MSGLSSDSPPEPVPVTAIAAVSAASVPGARDDDPAATSPSEQRDQVGEERDEAGGRRDRVGHRRDRAGIERDDAAGRRDVVAAHRDEERTARDHAGVRRDLAGAQRDRAGELRDQAAQRRDDAALGADSILGAPITAEILERYVQARLAAASDRTRASQDRQAGADERTMAHRDRGVAHADRLHGAWERARSHLDRAVARADRQAGAGERGEAELDRETALAHRGASAVDREHSSHDALTGAYLRGAGFAELNREVLRARRDNQPLVLAFLDVDDLKAANDTRGHAGGDRLLRSVADALRANLRAHDLIIRYGGDEFVCAVTGLHEAEAATRLRLVDGVLAGLPERASVTVGLAELRAGDSAEDLVARADDALYEKRQRQRAPRDR